MKDPLNITLKDLVAITSRSLDQGVAFCWSISPVNKTGPQPSEPEDAGKTDDREEEL